MTPNESDRFWAKVAKTETCWLWTASLTKGGYARFKVNGKTRVAHRWLYEQTIGPIAGDLQLDHLCRTPHCVRTDHLEAVSGAENIRRASAAKTHCKRGHKFTPENIIPKKLGRACKECNRIAAREYQREKFGYAPRQYKPTHCRRGHELTPDNARIKANGTRECWECRRTLDRERKRRAYVPKRQKAVASSTNAPIATVI
jgi:hypothetical protein